MNNLPFIFEQNVTAAAQGTPLCSQNSKERINPSLPCYYSYNFMAC